MIDPLSFMGGVTAAGLIFTGVIAFAWIGWRRDIGLPAMPPPPPPPPNSTVRVDFWAFRQLQNGEERAMNRQRRKDLRRAADLLAEVGAIIEQARSEEDEYFEAMPESIAAGEKGERAQAATKALEDAYEALGEVSETLEGVIGE